MSKGRRILLVDDESDNNRIFTIALGDAGFEVDAFEDPRLAYTTTILLYNIIKYWADVRCSTDVGQMTDRMILE